MEDAQIVALYWDRNEDAVRHSADKYGTYCAAIAGGILGSPEDTEECVNSTWLRAWQSMPPQKPQVLRLFFGRITRNLSFDRIRRDTARKRAAEVSLALDELADCLPGGVETEQAVDERLLQDSMHRFLCSIPTRDSDIFLRRYFFVESTDAIARRFGISRANVLTVLSRTRKKLRTHLESEGFSV